MNPDSISAEPARPMTSQRPSRWRYWLFATFGVLLVLGVGLVYLIDQRATVEAAAQEAAAAMNPLDPSGELAQLQTALDTLAARQTAFDAQQATITANLQTVENQLKTVDATLGQLSAQFQGAIGTMREQQQALGALTPVQQQLQRDIATLQKRDIGGEIDALLATLTQQDAYQRQLLHRLSAFDTQLHQQREQMSRCQPLLHAWLQQRAVRTAGQGGTVSIGAADQPAVVPTLPFQVTAIDRLFDQPLLVTVAEPRLAGKRRTMHLQRGDTYLSWTVERVNPTTVVFRHASGQSLTAPVEG